MASTQSKRRQAGADRVVMPASIGAQRMAYMITRPTTVEFMELLADNRFLDVELDEFFVDAKSSLVGKSIDSVVESWPHTMLIVAVKLADGKIVFRLEPAYTLAERDTVIVMGEVDAINRLRERLGIRIVR